MPPKAQTNVVRLPPGGRAAVPKKGQDVIANLNNLTKQAQGLSKKDKKNVKKFDKQFKGIAKQTGADAADFRADQTQRAAYRALTEMFLTIIPVAQEKYLENRSESTLYALRAAAEQLTALMSATRTLDSLEEQAEYVSLRIIGPTMVMIVSNLAMSAQAVKAQLGSLDLEPKQRQQIMGLMDGLIREHASYIAENQKALKANIEKYLVGD